MMLSYAVDIHIHCVRLLRSECLIKLNQIAIYQMRVSDNDADNDERKVLR